MSPRQACGTPERDLWGKKVSSGAATGATILLLTTLLGFLLGRKKCVCSEQLCHSPLSLAADRLLSRLPLSIQVFFLQPDLEGRGNLISSGSLPWSGNDRVVESSILGLWDQGRTKTAGTRGHFHAARTHAGWIHFSYAEKSLGKGTIQSQACTHAGRCNLSLESVILRNTCLNFRWGLFCPWAFLCNRGLLGFY